MKYGRVVTITIRGPDGRGRDLTSAPPGGGDGLHLAAVVRRSTDRADDVVELAAWGLAEATRTLLQQSGATATIAAGYGGRPVVLASGDVVPGSVESRKATSSEPTTWRISDGGISLRTLRIGKSWGITTSTAILDDVIALSGLARGIVAPARVVNYRRGYVALGSLESVLADVVADTGSQYAVAGGVLDVWPTGGQRQTRRVEISAASGMIDQPTPADQDRWTVRVLLEPSIRPGDVVQVRSSTLTGALRATNVEHAVDSGYDLTYYTTVQGVPL